MNLLIRCRLHLFHVGTDAGGEGSQSSASECNTPKHYSEKVNPTGNASVRDFQALKVAMLSQLVLFSTASLPRGTTVPRYTRLSPQTELDTCARTPKENFSLMLSRHVQSILSFCALFHGPAVNGTLAASGWGAEYGTYRLGPGSGARDLPSPVWERSMNFLHFQLRFMHTISWTGTSAPNADRTHRTSVKKDFATRPIQKRQGRTTTRPAGTPYEGNQYFKRAEATPFAQTKKTACETSTLTLRHARHSRHAAGLLLRKTSVDVVDC